MAIKIEGGVLASQNDSKIRGVVTEINFPQATRVNGKVPLESAGTAILKNPPDVQNFAKDEIVEYSDGNRNNTAYLRVTSVVGPAKYNLTRVD